MPCKQPENGCPCIETEIKEHLEVLPPFQAQHRLQFLSFFLNLRREKISPLNSWGKSRDSYSHHILRKSWILHWRISDSQKATDLLQKPLEQCHLNEVSRTKYCSPTRQKNKPSHQSPQTGPHRARTYGGTTHMPLRLLWASQDSPGVQNVMHFHSSRPRWSSKGCFMSSVDHLLSRRRGGPHLVMFPGHQ